MVLWWGSLPIPSSEEQFQRWSRSWCWHSWMATWMPCRAEAVTSGLRTHILIWRLLRPASLRHTELGVSTGSPATFRLRISLHSTLQKGRERERERKRERKRELVGGPSELVRSSLVNSGGSMSKDAFGYLRKSKNTKQVRFRMDILHNNVSHF